MQSENQGAIAQSFTFSTQAMRVITIDGEPWFCAADVCDILGYTNSRKALADHCRAGGVTKRDTPTSSGIQSMTYISEGNLYRLCIKSHMPEAQKFEAWVCDEVLPSIRKTGRYVAPAAAPVSPTESTAERLTANDLQHIKRMIDMCATGFYQKNSWTQAIWFYLRRVLNWPSPQPWTVDHLPRIGDELAYALSACLQVQELTRHIEHQAANLIFRDAADAQLVIAAMNKEAETRLATLKADRAKLPSYLVKTELPAMLGRKPAFVSWYPDEQPGLFSS